MNRIRSFLVIATLGVFLTAITGAALASPNGNGNGNGNGGGNSASAPGQQKQTAAAAPAPAPKAKHGGGQQAGNASAATPGMKPANNTAKGTHCSTGGSPGAATCTATGSNTAQAQAKSDASKRYGNGKTAAQIAVGRGAPAGTDIYGPGNSQPHKVTDCKHKHGVDVHAVKSYSSAGCAPSTPSSTETQAQTITSACPGTTVTNTTTVTSVKTQKGHAYGRLKHGKGLHSKTNTSTSTSSSFTPSGANCSPQSNTNASNTNTNTVTQQQSAAAAKQAGTSAQGGVLGAEASKSGKVAAAGTTKPARTGGVLGATGRAAHALGAVASRGSLPFTGLPVWIALLIGLALVAAGLALRHRGRSIA